MSETYSVEAFLKANVGDFQKGFDQAGKQLDDFKQSADQTEQKFAGGLSISKIAAGIGLIYGAKKALDMVKNSVQSAFGRIDTMEQFERVMTTMTGSSEKANEVLETIGDTVTGTAYGLDVAAKATQDFVTSNMDVDKATETVASWGDAVAFYGDGSNQTFASVSDALAKMTAKGKVQMDTMNRLTEAGIPAMQIYADATGKSVEEVADQMSKGELDAGKFTDVMNDALANGTKNFDGIAGAAKEAGASWGASFDNMQAAVTRGVVNIIQKIDEMLTENGLPDMREMVAEFGKKFEEALNKVVDVIPVVVDKLKGFYEVIKTVYENLKPWIPTILSIATGLLVAVKAFEAFRKVQAIITGVKATFLALNTTMLANPIFWLIAAMVAAVVLIYVYWEPISEFFLMIWGIIKETGLAIWDTLKEAWSATVEWLMIVWEPLAEFFANLWTMITEGAVIAWEFLSKTVMAIIQPFIDGITNIFNEMKDGLSKIMEGLSLYLEGAWELIKNIILGAVLLIVNLVTGDFEELKKNAKAIFENIKGALTKIWEGIKKMFSGYLSAILGYVTGVWNNIKAVTSTVFNAVKSTLTSIWSGIKTTVSNAVTSIKDTAKSKFNQMKTAISTAMTNVKTAISNGWDKAKTFLTGINLMSIGKDIINGLIGGIKSKVKAVGDAVKSVTSAITGKIKGILGIKSPSTVFAGFGVNLLEGLNEGIDSMVRSTIKTVTSLSEGITSTFDPELAMDGPDIAGQVNSINAQANRQMQSHLTSELNVGKQPIHIHVQGDSEWIRAYVNDENAIDATVGGYFD